MLEAPKPARTFVLEGNVAQLPGAGDPTEALEDVAQGAGVAHRKEGSVKVAPGPVAQHNTRARAVGDVGQDAASGEASWRIE